MCLLICGVRFMVVVAHDSQCCIAKCFVIAVIMRCWMWELVVLDCGLDSRFACGAWLFRCVCGAYLWCRVYAMFLCLISSVSLPSFL